MSGFVPLPNQCRLLRHKSSSSATSRLQQCQLNAVAIRNFTSNFDIIPHPRDSGITAASIPYYYRIQNTLFFATVFTTPQHAARWAMAAACRGFSRCCCLSFICYPAALADSGGFLTPHDQNPAPNHPGSYCPPPFLLPPQPPNKRKRRSKRGKGKRRRKQQPKAGPARTPRPPIPS